MARGWGGPGARLRVVLPLFWCAVWGGSREGSLGAGVGDAAEPDPGICSPLALTGPHRRRGPQGRRRWPWVVGSALAGWAQSRDQRLHLLLPPSRAAPGLIWHLPEEQPEALSLLSGLTSCTGVLRPCGRRSHGEPAVGIGRSTFLGSLAGHQVLLQSQGEGRLHHVAIAGPVVEGAPPSLP